MLTNKGKYGLKAMVHLAELPPGALAQVVEIAEANSISDKFLSHILTELRRAGLVYSKKGKGGGYGLARPAHEIRVGAIVRALDGPLAPIACASVTAFRPCDDCADLQTCAVRLIMIEARNAIANVLDHRTIIRDARKAPKTAIIVVRNRTGGPSGRIRPRLLKAHAPGKRHLAAQFCE